VIVPVISAKGQKIIGLKLCPPKVKNRPPDVEPPTAMALEPSESCSWSQLWPIVFRGKITLLFMRTPIAFPQRRFKFWGGALAALALVAEHGSENP
jgi:hypothetical protein